MPKSPKKKCIKVSCNNLTNNSYCDLHKKEINKHKDWNRKSSSQRGYSSRWQKARLTYLSKNPLCVICEKENKIVQAIIVDHIIPHKCNWDLFWNKENWQSLCKCHHDVKTAKEDGGFGRLVVDREGV